jgi:2-amino-4-hydroxy-6-hydroxymethyldihydropteridine diphosphokinase
MELHVFSANTAALALYQALGYQPAGTARDFYAPGLDALVYRKPLEPKPLQPSATSQPLVSSGRPAYHEPVHLRPAQPSDLPLLMQMIRRVVPPMIAAGNNQWTGSYPNRQVYAADLAAGALWIAATADCSLAGAAAYTTQPEPQYAAAGWNVDESAIFTHRLAVDPGQRGKGIAFRLMQHAEVIARERGIVTLRVDTGVAIAVRPGLRVRCYQKRIGELEGRIGRTAAVGLGSNLPSPWGGPPDNLREAVRRLAALGRVEAVSSFHQTAPVGYTAQPDFLNAALLLETRLEPLELMRGLLEIERAMGRDRSNAPLKGPRIIDLDLLLMDGLVLVDSRIEDSGVELTLPHPAMAARRFVLEPLAEIAPAMCDPVTRRTVAELLNALR